MPGGDDGGHPVPVERERAQRKPTIHPATLTARGPPTVVVTVGGAYWQA
jgi:hypothetical protein